MDPITIAQAAAILGTSVRNVRHHFTVGHLKGKKVNPRLILLERGSVETFVPNPRGPVPGLHKKSPKSRKRRRKA